MPVDARRRFELYAAFEPHLGDTTATLMDFLRETAERPDFQAWNYERFKREPARVYSLYAALRRKVGADVAATVLEILDPRGWAERWCEPSSEEGAG